MGIVRIFPRQIDQAAAAVGDALLWNATTRWTPTTLTSANISGFTESVQDVVGSLAIDSTTIDFTYNDVSNTLTAAAITQMTITSDGSGIKLVNDDATPGNNKIYGTNGSGVKGWYTSPSGADGNGIYTGDGTIGAGNSDDLVRAKLRNNGVFRFDYSNDNLAFIYKNLNGEGNYDIELRSKRAFVGQKLLDEADAGEEGGTIGKIEFYVPNSPSSAFEFSGNMCLASNGANTPDSKAVLELFSTTRALLLPRHTTPQFNAFDAADAGVTTDGMLVYHVDQDKLKLRANGAWVDLITSGGVFGGIYAGSGTIAPLAVATLTAASSFSINHSGGISAFTVADNSGAVDLFSGNGNSFLNLYNGSASVGYSNSNIDFDGTLTKIEGGITFASPLVPANITADQNNYAPANIGFKSTLKLTATVAVNITGLASTAEGKIYFIHNVGGFSITLKNESVASTEANRFSFGADYVIAPGKSVMIIYDSTSQRWRGASVANSYTVQNGLTETAGVIKLGGALTEVTTITGNTTNFLTVTGNRTAFDAASLVVNNTGATGPALKANATGSGSGVFGTTASGTAVYGSATTGLGLGAYTTGNVAALFTIEATATGTVLTTLTLDRLTSGAGADGIGSKILFRNETSTTQSVEANSIVSKWSNAIHAARLSEYSITGYDIATEKTLLTLSGTGAARLNQYGGAGFTGTATKTLQVDSSGNIIQGDAALPTPLNVISAASANGSADHTNKEVTWNWSTASTHAPLKFTANALTTGTVFDISTSNNTLNSSNGLFRVANTGTSQNGKLAEFRASSSAGSGMTWLTNGKVGIGQAAPSTALHVLGSGGIRVDSGIINTQSTGDNFSTDVATSALRIQNTTAINGRSWYLGSMNAGHLMIGNEDNSYIQIAKTSGMFRIFNSLAAPGTSTGLLISADTNNWNPNVNEDTFAWKVSATGAFNITGIEASYQGRLIMLINTGVNQITLKKNDGNSNAVNRILMRNDVVIAQDNSVMLWYDNGDSRWRVVSQS